jgi:hypothetical protein
VTREVSYYQDLASGEIVERWTNPLNGKTVCVVQVANDPADVLSDTQRSTPTHYSWFRTDP